MANIIYKSSRGRRGLVMHLEYPSGKGRKVQGRSMTEVTSEAIRQARKDGFDFQKGSDVSKWEKL
jgi:hypothetical protein